MALKWELPRINFCSTDLPRDVRFVDGFTPFFREPAGVAIGRYFIPGDVHFTEAGNRLIFDTVKKAVGDDW